ncbi:DUF4148 domain-containing protein [Burkholderia sp. L27(2015)]|uniref:DUF4148 domain-containing protein n=1 Tax=Burkholderia sp. L27(2015) TaxID=1641858 RepID=UPI00131C3C5D|nr:DUF4148 domain-containing protein [Burkholderia sp. L27(2015)]
MKNKLFAALLVSAAVVASAPAFAGNANVGDDVSTWAGVSTKTRAEVRQELIQAQQQGFIQANDDTYYPSVATTGPSKSRAEVKRELAATPNRQLAAGENENTMYPTRADVATSYSAPAVALSQGNGQAAANNE